jgi:D-alanyl-D-alanine carboxypeptidase
MRSHGRILFATRATCVVALSLAACSSGSRPPRSTTDAPQASSSAPSSLGSGSASARHVITVFGTLPTNEIDASTATAFQQVLDTSVGAGSPAVLAAVLTPEGTWVGAAGVDGPAGRKATPDDVWAIASVSKTFTAALIFKLAEAGQVDLDKPLSTYLGGLEVDTNGATVRQALAMRSGLPDTPDSAIAKVNASPRHVWTTAEVIAAFPPAVAPPGAEYDYSNPTYKLLDLVAEQVTSSSLAVAMRSEVLDPAHSPRSLLVQTATSKTPEPWALPVVPDDLSVAQYGTGGALPSVSDATFSLAASGMAGDARALASWAWQLFAGKVVSKESLATMAEVDGDGYGLGLGLDRFTTFGTTAAYGHTGSKSGYESLLVVFPERQEVVVVGVTQRDADVTTIAADLLAASPR